MNMLSIKQASLAATVALAFLASAGSAHAGDCKSVKFWFKNSFSSKIKVLNVEVAGNDGTWTEDISNKEILTNGTHTTDARTMNKLDSGMTPAWMKVKYDKWDSANGRWNSNLTKTFTNRVACSDGHTYNFVMQ